MYRKLVALILVLSMLTPTVSFAESGVSTTLTTIPSNNLIDSMLMLELDAKRDGNHLLSSSSRVPVVLAFETQLTDSAIRFAESLGIEFARRGSSVVHVGRVYNAWASSISSIRNLAKIGLLKASPGKKQFFTSLPSSVNEIGASGVLEYLTVDGSSINGSGVMVAVIDTGAAWLHPSFWRQSSGELEILVEDGNYFADIDGDGQVDDNEGPINHVDVQNPAVVNIDNEYMYIDVEDDGGFDYAEGDRWIGGIDGDSDGVFNLQNEDVVLLGESKVAFLYDQENSNVYQRGVNLTTMALSVGDPHGHGTHVSSTVAGGQPGLTSFVGVSPGADLMIIKSPLDSFSIIDGIHFAVENGADVINMSFSSYLSFLDGTDVEDMAVTEAFLDAGVMSTLAAGNLGGRSKHAHFDAQSGSSAATTLSVNNPPSNSFLNILWYSEDQDEHVILTPPAGGDEIDLGAFSSLTGSAYSLQTQDINAYVFADTSSKGRSRLLIQVSTSDHNWTTGTWTVEVDNPSGDAVHVDAYSWDNSWSGNHMTLTTRLSNSRTLSSPGTADLGVCVSSYSESSSTISSTSSLGPRIDGAPFPTVAAPGVGINAARNSLTSLWTTRSGTSMAAPHVAGLIALIRQTSQTNQGWLEISALIEGAGGTNLHYSPADPAWGHGLVDAPNSIHHLRDVSTASGSSYGNWFGVRSIISDPEDSGIAGGLDVMEVKAYQTKIDLALAIRMRETVDLSGSETLSFEWDIDDDVGTGNLGIDLVVNVTSSVATVYEWTGSEFDESDLTVEWWNKSVAAFVKVERPDSDVKGTIVINTYNQTDSMVDQTSEAALSNQWRPLISSVGIDETDGYFNINVNMIDKDSEAEQIKWDVVDGNQDALETDSIQDTDAVTFNVNLTEISHPYLASLMIKVTSEQESIYMQPIILTSGLSTELRFSSAFLDSSTARVGFLIDDQITGELELDGYLLVETVSIAFLSEFGYSLNFTLTGNDGTYPIEVSPSGFSAGEYDVYAVAESKSGMALEMNFATLTVVEDNSMLLLLGTAGVVVVVIILVLPKILVRMKK